MSARLIHTVLAFAALIILGCLTQRRQVSYSQDIKPILNKKCLRCHGGIKANGGLSFLFREEAFGETESGLPAIVAGKSSASEMIQRIKSHDPELRMPQDDDPLEDHEIRLLERWIDQGAEWDDHWSYTPLVDPEIPSTSGPFALTDLDHFVVDELATMSLQPNEAAPPPALARRLSFDLLGLPADIELAADYLRDPTMEQYRQLVNDLLASPHYGEQMASMWLDLARYADSQGYEKDAHRDIWRYRDWLIDAFNRDLPFDQFTIDQLAGDLVPNPTKEQLIATAFHRNTMTNAEGGTEDEEYRTAAVVDRVNSTFEIWQGTTISCVQCHSHPYDPFTQEEYFGLYALFNNTQDADLDNEFPFLLEVQDSLEHIQAIAQWISAQTDRPREGHQQVSGPQIRALMWPRLFADLSDDFQDVLVGSTTFSNSSYNANNQKHKKYYLIFRNCDLTGLEGFRYRYRSHGSDAQIQVRLDSIDGPVISTHQMQKSKDWQWTSAKSEPVDGRHDLIFHFINTTGDFRNGVVHLREIELTIPDEPIGPQLRKKQDRLLSMYRNGTRTPIMKERSALLARQTFVHERGNYLVPGKQVEPGLPTILNGSGRSVQNRLELAQWLVSEDNPLTARVIANRIWAMVFGHGIVETSEDFGTQGIPPTHRALLDHLAYRFSHDFGWSIKQLLTYIVCSATYRQSSEVTPQKIEGDPYNKYYSRGVRKRLSAEQIRDQALAIGELLNPMVGGASVMPPQPEGVWQVVYSNAKWYEDNQADKYRRGLYTYWKRTTPYPSMVAFDSPSREFCVSRRIPTNTPLQALVTLNDTVYIEAASGLAAWMQDQHPDDLTAAVVHGYEKALLEKPDPETLRTLMDLLDTAGEQLTPAASDETKAPAPMVIVANAIMNLDAFLTKS